MVSCPRPEGKGERLGWMCPLVLTNWPDFYPGHFGLCLWSYLRLSILVLGWLTNFWTKLFFLQSGKDVAKELGSQLWQVFCASVNLRPPLTSLRI